VTDVKKWCRDIVEGIGGLDDFNRYEMACLDSQLDAVEWAVRCLANPKCEGSREVLDAIESRREQAGEAPSGAIGLLGDAEADLLEAKARIRDLETTERAQSEALKRMAGERDHMMEKAEVALCRAEGEALGLRARAEKAETERDAARAEADKLRQERDNHMAQADWATRELAATRDVVEKAEADLAAANERAEALRAALAELGPRPHGRNIGRCYYEERFGPGSCECGADEHNARVQAALAAAGGAK
jgi:hypothetical protein